MVTECGIDVDLDDFFANNITDIADIAFGRNMWMVNNSGELCESFKKLPEPVTTIYCGITAKLYNNTATERDSVFALTADGRVLVWGANQFGELGLGHSKEVIKPTELQGFDNVIKFAIGVDHVLFLTADGTVYGIGENDENQIGGKMDNYTKPRRIKELEGRNIVDIAAGGSFSLALTDDGRVYSFGSNTRGTLGRDGESAPKLIRGLDREVVISISCAFSHAMAATGT
jgi:alpha-tubulin suppressor-like RCC1 family protein